jgi:hypothetical protein
MTPLFKKLNLSAQTSIAVLNAPPSFEAETVQLKNIEIVSKLAKSVRLDFVIAFVITQKELDAHSKAIATATVGDAVVWIAYPKQSSKKYRCEFNRDDGWTVLGEAGFEPVRQVAIDEDWSALRFRRVEFIKTMTRGFVISTPGKAKATRHLSQTAGKRSAAS